MPEVDRAPHHRQAGWRSFVVVRGTACERSYDPLERVGASEDRTSEEKTASSPGDRMVRTPFRTRNETMTIEGLAKTASRPAWPSFTGPDDSERGIRSTRSGGWETRRRRRDRRRFREPPAGHTASTARRPRKETRPTGRSESPRRPRLDAPWEHPTARLWMSRDRLPPSWDRRSSGLPGATRPPVARRDPGVRSTTSRVARVVRPCSRLERYRCDPLRVKHIRDQATRPRHARRPAR